MARDDVAERLHGALRDLEVEVRGTVATIAPVFAPRLQSRADVFEPLHRKQVGRNRYNHVVGCDEGSAVDGTKIRSNVQNCDIGSSPFTDPRHHSMKGSSDTKR